MKIAIDFDGTCVMHEFPLIGKDVGAIPVLKELVAKGHLLILFTMRADKGDNLYLKDAIDWFYGHDIELHGIQKDPGQESWTTSPKAYAQLYIDDAALGIPLAYPYEEGRPYVDWVKVRHILKERQIL